MGANILQYLLYFIILIVLAVPLGLYISKVMNGEKVFLSRILKPVERVIYKVLKIEESESMTWKTYLLAILLFSGLGFILLFIIVLLQGMLPLNPAGANGLRLDLAFNTAVSYITNTNWQAYQGESDLSYLTQMIGLTTQNFVSAAVGICVLFALIRGFIQVNKKGLGNFWVDLTRSVLYILLPLSLVVSIFIVSQGVPQTLKGYETVDLVEAATDDDGNAVTKQIVPLGPAASQIAIKQLGTNGGGYFGSNSAHPLENPTWWSNLVELISILLIPVALCFSFGQSIKDKKQGLAIFMAMLILLVAAVTVIGISEQAGTPVLSASQGVDPIGGNMEGKETRLGIAASSIWTGFTTAAANGSTNSTLDSYTPLGGMVPMLLMQLGEVVFGGIGSGLYGMMAFVILTVFISGLMVGRTPEYLGKKIEPYEMRMAVVICLTTPVLILIGSGLSALLPDTVNSLNNSGAHGFSELLYAFSSVGANNGSAFAGFAGNTVFFNVLMGIIMLAARFIPMTAVLAIAGSLSEKKKLAVGPGSLATNNGMFVFLLIIVVLLIGALSFFPALALGPIAEHFQM